MVYQRKPKKSQKKTPSVNNTRPPAQAEPGAQKSVGKVRDQQTSGRRWEKSFSFSSGWDELKEDHTVVHRQQTPSGGIATRPRPETAYPYGNYGILSGMVCTNTSDVSRNFTLAELLHLGLKPPNSVDCSPREKRFIHDLRGRILACKYALISLIEEIFSVWSLNTKKKGRGRVRICREIQHGGWGFWYRCAKGIIPSVFGQLWNNQWSSNPNWGLVKYSRTFVMAKGRS